MKNLPSNFNSIIMHVVLFTYTIICLFPVYLLVNNSFKSRRALLDLKELLTNKYTGNKQIIVYVNNTTCMIIELKFDGKFFINIDIE